FVAIRAPSQGAWYGPIFIFLVFSTIVLVMLRFGVFATMWLMFAVDTPPNMFMTTDFTAWYGQSSWVIVALLAAIALWAFRTTLVSRRRTLIESGQEPGGSPGSPCEMHRPLLDGRRPCRAMTTEGVSIPE